MYRCVVLALTVFVGACSVLTSYSDSYAPSGEPLREGGGLQGTYTLPRTIFDIQVKSGPNNVETLSIAKKIEPDPRARLLYRFEPSSTSDDIIEVQVDESGLLTSIATDTKDQSGAIAVKLAELVAAIATNGANGPQQADLPEGGLPTTTLYAASYDPLNPLEANEVRRSLRTIGQKYCILVGREALQGSASCPAPESKANYIAPSAQGAALDYVHRYPGIFYRRPAPMPIKVFRQTRDQKGKVEWAAAFSG